MYYAISNGRAIFNKEDKSTLKDLQTYIETIGCESWELVNVMCIRIASSLTTGVKHPGASAGIIQEVIVVDLILDHPSIRHMEGQIDTHPGIPAIV